MGILQDYADDFARRLRERDQQAARSLAVAYDATLARLEEEFLLLEALDPSSEKASALRYRYEELARKIAVEAERYGDIARPQIGIAKANAAEAGARDAIGLMRAGLGGPKTGGFGVGFVNLPAEAVERIAAHLGDGSPLATLFSDISDYTLEAARRTIVRGVALGYGPEKIARELRDVTDVPLQRARTIARTETLRAYRDSALETYRANKNVVEKWIWHAALQRRTCPVCWALHGTEHNLGERMAAHVNCRCTMVPKVKRWEEMGITPPAGYRQPAAGIEPGILAFAKLSPADQRAILGPTKYRMYAAGDIGLSDVVGYERNRVWGTSVRVKGLRELSVKPPARVVERPLEALGAFTSYKEAERTLAAKYPAIVFDLEGMDIELINSNFVQFDKLAQEWPDIERRLEYVGTYRNPPAGMRLRTFEERVMAHATRDGKVIAFNPDAYGDVARYQASVKAMVFSRYLQPGATHPAAILTHEWGHQVHNYLRARQDALFPFVAMDGRGLASDLTGAFERHNRATKKVSGYATTNAEESFAEGFAMREHTPRAAWPVYVKRLDALIGIQRGKSYAEGEYQFPRDMTADAAREARARLNEWYEGVKKRLNIKE